MRERRADGRYAEQQKGYRLAHRLRQFGLTPAEHAALVEAQGGTCAMCHQACTTGRQLAVDHDHRTGRVRGLLCNPCNRALGTYERVREAAEAYLAER